jgi:hypothetical protein
MNPVHTFNLIYYRPVLILFSHASPIFQVVTFLQTASLISPMNAVCPANFALLMRSPL